MADKSILDQQTAGNVVDWTNDDEAQIWLAGENAIGSPDPSVANISDIEVGVIRYTSFTGDGNGFENATNYLAPSGGVSVGQPLIAWDGTDSAWEPDKDGTFDFVFGVKYSSPASPWATEPDTSRVGFAQLLKRKHTAAIELNGTVVSADIREHDNIRVYTSEPFWLTARYRCSLVTTDEVKVYIEGYEWPTAAGMSAWAMDSAYVAIARLNKEMA